MVHGIRKRTLFFISILFAGLLGVLNNHIRTNYSKNDSLLVPTAHADIGGWDWTVPGACGDGGGGCGCGGCTGDSSAG